MNKKDPTTAGRGALINPHNRFHANQKGADFFDNPEPDFEPNKTRFIEIFPKTIVNKVTSPDVGMVYSLNPYQGCEHGCTYCYARPTHEYWGYSAGTDFEQVILVKKNAPELLEVALRKRGHTVQAIGLSGNTDCYQPCERNYGITRQLLEIFLKYKHPVGIITKNALIERDIDLLQQLAQLNLVHVHISITSLQEDVRRKLEPRTATAKRKLEIMRKLTDAGVPVTAMLAPIIPAINDHELFNLAKAVSEHGAVNAHYQVVRLNGPNEAIFKNWLEHHFPDRAQKVIHQLEDIHGGKVSNSQFGNRMRGNGIFSINLKRQFEIAKKRFFSQREPIRLRTDLFRVPSDDGQLELF